MHIIVTTPAGLASQAAQEAEDVKAWGGGEYFRSLGPRRPKSLEPGDRCYYAERGFVRGYATVVAVEPSGGETCETSGAQFGQGWYARLDATTWTWIQPVEYRGFQGWRYYAPEPDERELGGWLDPMPEAPIDSYGKLRYALRPS